MAMDQIYMCTWTGTDTHGLGVCVCVLRRDGQVFCAPSDWIGKLAAGMLVDRIEGRTVAQKSVDVGFELIECGSA